MQRNMPHFVRLVVDYFYDRIRKKKNLQYGDRTQNPEWSWYVQFQRAAQIELWTGQKAPLDVMRKVLKEIIREEKEKAQTE